MYVSFNDLPENARIWVYQASRPLDDGECREILDKGSAFTEEWTAHRKSLKASLEVYYNRFLVMGVDQSFNETSGCSIDSSVNFLKELERYLSRQFEPVTFFDPTEVAYFKNGEILTTHFKNLKDEIAKGNIRKNTFTFDNLVSEKGQLETRWLVQAEDSWLNRYFQN